MNNNSVFFASFLAAGALMWAVVVIPHKIDCWLRVRRRLAESQPSEAKTTVITMKAMAKPTVNNPILTISEPPSAMLGNRYR